MIKSGKLITSFATTAAALMLTGVPVLAATAELAPLTTIDAQGGTWNYGVGSKYVWSYYSHKKKTHKSSVQGKIYVSSGWQPKGTQARASAEKKFSGNQAYYAVK